MARRRSGSSSSSRRRRRRSTTSSRRRRNPRAQSLKLRRSSGEMRMPERMRTLSVRVTVGRDRQATQSSGAFVACAYMGKVKKCASARNPHMAIGEALSKVGSSRSSSKGAFAGLGGTRKRRRRRARR